ncbi:MAG TPA: hypothetical protein VFJ90_00020 [Candidatus Didemnitutus sp.]|nr:hypothetical protein [Candidatus Didemnitutus sp.]
MKPLLSVLLALLLSSVVRADNRDDDHRGGPRVILYENSDFRGNSLTLYPGESIENLGNATFDGGGKANDRISSIRIEGGAELRVYSDSKYRGETLRLTHDVRDLAGLFLANNSKSWNDQISSLQVEGRDYGHRSNGRGSGDPDKIIKRAYQDILLRDPDPTGLRDFHIKMIDQGWTEQQVRESLRRSEEFRGKVVNDMIGRAYRDTLGREPDPRGLDHYRNQILDHDWTEASVRDDLRKSDEYKRRPKA